MISSIQETLKTSFPEELVSDLMRSYTDVRDNFRKENYTETICKSGRFSENIFRILHYLSTNEVVQEVKDMKKIEQLIQDNKQLSESIRLIIPRVARSIIYTLRSKRDAVHVKEQVVTYMDATLNMTSVNWILSELLREFSSMREEDIVRIIHELMKHNYPLIQRFEGEKVVVKNLGAESELLLVLLDSGQEGLTRKEIGKIIKNFSPSTISNLLKKLLKSRKIYQSDSGRYFITDPGEKEISNTLATS
jgi:hypothetical protein